LLVEAYAATAHFMPANDEEEPMKDQKGEMNGKSLRERFRASLGDGWRVLERNTVVLRGRRGVTVHGCRKILQYSPIEIRLELNRSAISIEGEGLYCTSFGTGSVTVEGNVRRVTYLEQTENGEWEVR
jgi:sporulation protein YqfC